VLIVAGFILARDSQFIQGNPNLARIANISSKDLVIRATIWGMAWEGVKERPILGWGQSNFNYVFNEQYDPSLYAQEQWFDRSHNIIMDWLITGGVLGFLAYFSIFFACLYYLFIRPIIDKEDNSFTVLERGVLLGILAGYLTHNFVVFDNIVSYIFFAIILGLIHSRVSTPIKEIDKVKVDEAVIVQFATPVVAALVIFTIYFAHMPGMAAAGDIIDAMRVQSPEKKLEAFKQALGRDSFAQQEIVEQLAQMSMGYMRDQKVDEKTRQNFAAYTEEQLLKLAQDKPGDARIHVFIGSYYRTIGQLDKAAEQMQIAHELSPRKSSIMEQQAFVELSRGDNEKAAVFMKEAFELDTRNLSAREYYAGTLFYTKKTDEAIALMNGDPLAKDRFAMSDFVLGAANEAKATDLMIELFERRIELTPATDKNAAQNWATLAYLYHDKGDMKGALRVLEEGTKQVPTFAPTASCLSNNIKLGKAPEEGC
jgi:tetratricopeptide (TPR) repeat protein